MISDQVSRGAAQHSRIFVTGGGCHEARGGVWMIPRALSDWGPQKISEVISGVMGPKVRLFHGAKNPLVADRRG